MYRYPCAHSWIARAMCGCFPRWFRRQTQPARANKRTSPNRVSLRLEECERLELPGSIWALHAAFIDAAVVQATAPSAQEAPVSPGRTEIFASDTAATTGYNLSL